MEKTQYLLNVQTVRKLKASNSKALIHLFFDLILVSAAIIFSLNDKIFLWILGQLLLFMCIWRNFSILHTCVHNAFFPKRSHNTVAGWVCSVLALIPFGKWRQSHLDHHSWAGFREKDPSLSTPKTDEISPRMKKFLNICWKLHLPIFSVFVTALKKGQYKNIKDDYSGIFLAGVHILLIILMGISYLKVFCLPFFLYLFTSDFVIISQHNMLEDHKINPEDFPLPPYRHDEVTRELSFPPFFGKYILLNFDQHLIHHYFPTVPHYEISRLNFKNTNTENWWSWIKRVHKYPGTKVYLE